MDCLSPGITLHLIIMSGAFESVLNIHVLTQLGCRISWNSGTLGVGILSGSHSSLGLLNSTILGLNETCGQMLLQDAET